MRDFARIVLGLQTDHGIVDRARAAQLALRLAIDSGLWADWGCPSIDDQRDLAPAIQQLEQRSLRAKRGRPPRRAWGKLEQLAAIALYLQKSGARPMHAIRLAEDATGCFAGSEPKLRSEMRGLERKWGDPLPENFRNLVDAAYASLTNHRRGRRLTSLADLLARDGNGKAPGRPRKHPPSRR
jgi:hypothetical protein